MNDNQKRFDNGQMVILNGGLWRIEKNRSLLQPKRIFARISQMNGTTIAHVYANGTESGTDDGRTPDHVLALARELIKNSPNSMPTDDLPQAKKKAKKPYMTAEEAEAMIRDMDNDIPGTSMKVRATGRSFVKTATGMWRSISTDQLYTSKQIVEFMNKGNK